MGGRATVAVVPKGEEAENPSDKKLTTALVGEGVIAADNGLRSGFPADYPHYILRFECVWIPIKNAINTRRIWLRTNIEQRKQVIGLHSLQQGSIEIIVTLPI